MDIAEYKNIKNSVTPKARVHSTWLGAHKEITIVVLDLYK